MGGNDHLLHGPYPHFTSGPSDVLRGHSSSHASLKPGARIAFVLRCLWCPSTQRSSSSPSLSSEIWLCLKSAGMLIWRGSGFNRIFLNDQTQDRHIL